MELLDKISALEEEASQFGFKWQHAAQIMNQIHSECDEIKEHLDHDPSKANQTALQAANLTEPALSHRFQ
jgi:hypothetical protein